MYRHRGLIISLGGSNMVTNFRFNKFSNNVLLSAVEMKTVLVNEGRGAACVFAHGASQSLTYRCWSPNPTGGYGRGANKQGRPPGGLWRHWDNCRPALLFNFNLRVRCVQRCIHSICFSKIARISAGCVYFWASVELQLCWVQNA